MLGKRGLEIAKRRTIECGDVPKKRELPLDAYPEGKPVEMSIFKKKTSTHQNNREEAAKVQEEAELDRRIKEIAQKMKGKLDSIEEDFYRKKLEINKASFTTNNQNKVE